MTLAIYSTTILSHFTGSPWVILNRSFLEFCILGWDNLPRTLLMYFTNVILSDEGYFHSVICNSPEFRNTTVNNDLRYVIWDSPPKMEPHFLNVSDYDQTVQSGAAFARQFQKDDPVLNMIDEKILKRGRNRVVPGAWCTGRKSWWMDPCSNWGDANVLRPGLQAKKLEESVTNLLEGSNSQSNQCKWILIKLKEGILKRGAILVHLKYIDLFERPSVRQILWLLLSICCGGSSGHGLWRWTCSG